MAFTITTSQGISAHGGTKFPSSVLTSGGLMELYSNFAEGDLCADTRVDWVATQSTNARIDNMTKNAANARAAFYGVAYDDSVYTSRLAWQTKLDELDNIYNKIVAFLKDKTNQTFN